MGSLIASLQETSSPPAGGARLRSLVDLAELLLAPVPASPIGRLMLDADHLPRADLGIVTRFLTRAPRWELWLFGEDDRCWVAQRLLALPQARWCGWPPDLEQLQRALVAPVDSRVPSTPPPARHSESDPAPRAPQSGKSPSAPPPEQRSEGGPAPRAPQFGKSPSAPDQRLETDLAKIESILAGDPLSSVSFPDPDGSSDALDEAELILTHEELEAFQASLAASHPLDQESDEPEQTPATQPPSPSTLSSAPPRWYRSQVADLADIAQRLDLALNALREQHQDADPAGKSTSALDETIERLGHDGLRLVQFARTLGYLAAPPGRGDDPIRLDTLLEESLAGMADTGSDRARFLFRAEGPLEVRSDKGLLVLVLDAILTLASSAAGPQGEVRASALEVTGEGGTPQAELRISFPAGPLADIPAPEVLEPYGLRGKLPGLGPNALAAASRIMEGQGGSLLYGEDSDPGQALFILSLPCA
jgi:hypothetical protein